MRRKKCVYLDILTFPLLELSCSYFAIKTNHGKIIFCPTVFLFIHHQFVALYSNMHFSSVLWTEENYENFKNPYQILENGLQ